MYWCVGGLTLKWTVDDCISGRRLCFGPIGMLHVSVCVFVCMHLRVYVCLGA